MSDTKNTPIIIANEWFNEYTSPAGERWEAFECTDGRIYCEVDNCWDKEFASAAEWDAYRAEHNLEWSGADRRDF